MKMNKSGRQKAEYWEKIRFQRRVDENGKDVAFCPGFNQKLFGNTAESRLKVHRFKN